MTVGAPSIGVEKSMSTARAFSRKAPGGLLEQRLEADLLAHDPELVRLEPGQVEQVADQPVEPAHLLVHGLERLVELVGADHALGDGLDVARDGGERRPQLVGDAHQEVALELVDLAQPVDHALEPGGELAQLVVGVALADHVHVEVAAGHLVGGAADHAERMGDPAGDVGRQDQGDGEADRQAHADEADDVLPGVVDVGQRAAEHDRADGLVAEEDRGADADERRVVAPSVEELVRPGASPGFRGRVRG